MAKEKIKISNTDHCNGKSISLFWYEIYNNLEYNRIDPNYMYTKKYLYIYISKYLNAVKL